VLAVDGCMLCVGVGVEDGGTVRGSGLGSRTACLRTVGDGGGVRGVETVTNGSFWKFC
jgi:hypothetical protein